MIPIFHVTAQVVTYCDYLYKTDDVDLDSRGLSFVSVRGFQTAVSELFSRFNRPSPFNVDKSVFDPPPPLLLLLFQTTQKELH